MGRRGEGGGLAERIGLPRGKGGRITVGPDLSIDGHPEAFAIGDIADIDDGDGGQLPQLAQVAMQGGTHAAEQILADVRGADRTPFRYRNKGTMATIGRRAAVAEIPLPGGRSLKMKGSLAGWHGSPCTWWSCSASATGCRS